MSSTVLFILLLATGLLMLRKGFCKCGKVKVSFLIPGTLLTLLGAFGIFTALL